MVLVRQADTILQLIADDRIKKSRLFTAENNKLRTPISEDTLSIMTYRSKREDKPVNNRLPQLLESIQADGKFKGLNHIGFCYKVPSKKDELARIIEKASKKGLHVYQEPSIDDADWLFVGDIADVTSPLLEFLPLENDPNDKWVDYWLPHIQFDIDTGLSADEIKALVQTYMPQPGSPYPIQIDDITYIQRVNLGCVEGVNLMLDISTNSRDINHRKTWKKLI